MLRDLALLVVVISLVVRPSLAESAPGYQIHSFSVQTKDVPKLIVVVDRLMETEAARRFKGIVFLQKQTIDGTDEATYNLEYAYVSLADFEAFLDDVADTRQWRAFQRTMDDLTIAVDSSAGVLQQSWGTEDPSNVVWLLHYLTSNEPIALAGAVGGFVKSPSGQRFSGPLHLARISFNGLDSPTHALSMGFPTLAALDDYLAYRDDRSDHDTLVNALRSASDYRGTTLMEIVKQWGIAVEEVITD